VFLDLFKIGLYESSKRDFTKVPRTLRKSITKVHYESPKGLYESPVVFLKKSQIQSDNLTIETFKKDLTIAIKMEIKTERLLLRALKLEDAKFYRQLTSSFSFGK
jgi:hypothetical protein